MPYLPPCAKPPIGHCANRRAGLLKVIAELLVDGQGAKVAGNSTVTDDVVGLKRFKVFDDALQGGIAPPEVAEIDLPYKGIATSKGIEELIIAYHTHARRHKRPDLVQVVPPITGVELDRQPQPSGQV